MEFLKILLENWWQALIILCGFILLFVIVGKTQEKFLELLIKLIRILSKELSLRTASVRAAIMNLFFGVLAAIIAVILVTPSILNQLGFTEGNSNNSLIAVFLFVIAHSGYVVHQIRSMPSTCGAKRRWFSHYKSSGRHEYSRTDFAL